MERKKEEFMIQEKIKRLLKDPPGYKLSDGKRREFIARLYDVTEEKKNIVHYIFSKESRRLVGAAATLSVLFFVYNYLFAALNPYVCNATGTVKIYRSARNEWVMFENGRSRIGKDDIVKTFSDGGADLTIPNLYHIRMKTNTEIKLALAGSRAIPGKTIYELAKGKVFTDKRHSGMREPFEICTPEARARALGTEFMVESIPELSRTRVSVLDGAVRVTSIKSDGLIPDDTVMVEAGEKTVVNKYAAPERPAVLLEDDLRELEELYRIGEKQQVALLISTGRGRTRELLSYTPLYISAGKPSFLPAKIEQIARQFSHAVKEGSKEDHLNSIKEFEEIVDRYSNPKYDVQLLLFIGAYYEYLNEHEKAIETFGRVVSRYPRSSLASIAQCAIAIIYDDALKDSRKAKESYGKVLSDYPKSPEAEEALAELEKLSK